jgi:hypothetical protein
MAGKNGIYDRWKPHLAEQGFEGVESFFYDEAVAYTHKAWRGRMRACNGALAVPDPARRAELDAAVGRMLGERFAEPLIVPHRVFVVHGRAPARASFHPARQGPFSGA